MAGVRRVGIFGLGLIGGSIAKALKFHGKGVEIYGADRSRKRKKLAIEEGVLSGTLTSKNIGEMDVIFLAVPVKASSSIGLDLLSKMRNDAILTDCGSVKGRIYRELSGYKEGPIFVAGHPIAGTEKSGYENGFPELFENRIVFLCPYRETPWNRVKVVKQMWEEMGAKVLFMDPFVHDHVFAFVSHLPHAVAYSLVHSIATFDSPLPLGYSAGGFKDFTRIASSDPIMWTEIMLDNRDEILRAILHFRGSLRVLEKLVREGDAEGMLDYFRKSKRTRDSLVGG